MAVNDQWPHCSIPRLLFTPTKQAQQFVEAVHRQRERAREEAERGMFTADDAQEERLVAQGVPDARGGKQDLSEEELLRGAKQDQQSRRRQQDLDTLRAAAAEEAGG